MKIPLKKINNRTSKMSPKARADLLMRELNERTENTDVIEDIPI